MTLLLALLLEWAFGDPPNRWHAVAGFGRLARAIEHALYPRQRERVRAPEERGRAREAGDDPERGRGSPGDREQTRLLGVAAWALAVVPLVTAVAWALQAVAGFSEAAGSLLGAVVLWTTLGWRSLIEHVRAVGDAPTLDVARERVGRIVGRDTSAMQPVDVRRAALESLAENASDAVVASLFWAAVAGPAGALLHRLANTLDALWGHRNARYRHFGWCAARVDDVLNWIPARVTALCYACVAQRWPTREERRQAARHASPNAGWPEAALAHALGVRLGGPVARAGQTDLRPWLGPVDAREPDVFALADGVRLTRAALGLAAILGALAWL